jgi:hypothetical protein
MSFHPLAIIRELRESIANHDRPLEGLRFGVKANAVKFRKEIDELRGSFVEDLNQNSNTSEEPDPTPDPISPPIPVSPFSPSESRQAVESSHSRTSLKEVEFPLRKNKRRDGIIQYLTRKHGGNVHDKGIVIITSKSLDTDNSNSTDTRNVVDLMADKTYFVPGVH